MSKQKDDEVDNVKESDVVNDVEDTKENEIDNIEDDEEIDEDEFIVEEKETKKPYYTRVRQDGTKVVVVDTAKLTEADKIEVQMLVSANHKIVRKRKDITKSEMLNYVKNNYDEKEQDKFQTKVNELSNNFMKLKKYFKDRYKYYPRSYEKSYSYNKDKQERFQKAFQKHRNELNDEKNAETEAKK